MMQTYGKEERKGKKWTTSSTIIKILESDNIINIKSMYGYTKRPFTKIIVTHNVVCGLI